MRASVTACSWAMRARSVDSRAAISASSSARVRSISCALVSCSLRIRASRRTRSCDAGLLDLLARRDFLVVVRPLRAISRARISRSEAIRASAMARSLAMRAFSIASRAVICACSASVSRIARSRASSARCSARRISTSRSCSSRASSLSRSISSACFSASRLRVRILIIESCSMSLRSLRRASISSIRWVRPSASNRFEGLKNSRSVWSRSVIATDSSSSPFCARRLAAASLTRAT